MGRHTATAGVLTAITLALTGCGGAGPVASPSASASSPSAAGTSSPAPSPVPSASSPAVPPAAAGTGVPGPDRQTMIVAVSTTDEPPAFSVTADDRIGGYPASADSGERERFTVLPVEGSSGTYQLRTAAPANRRCVVADPQRPGLRVGACSAAAPDQGFRFAPKGRDGQTRQTFELTVNGFNVEVAQRSGAYAGFTIVERGDSPARTAFVFIDVGPAR